ncbi:MAG: sodium:proton antiporter NhaD [Bacteroidota bacterium]
MQVAIILIIFVAGYFAIAFEHVIGLNKAASALITGVLCWVVYIMPNTAPEQASGLLLGHLGDIASIVFFLLGAMTIVSLIDSHNGFDIITRLITTDSKRKLFFTITLITFFLSALLDNLTTAIVMVSLCQKLLPERHDRLWFTGMIVIAANAGGAWSPLGDVSTTMLWIGGQITPVAIISSLILPAIMVCILPALVIAQRFKHSHVKRPPVSDCTPEEQRDGKLILFCGTGFLIFVPIFKTITHLPPFMGMMLALGMMWIITNTVHKKKDSEYSERFTVTTALQKIDTPSILFFLGILLAVSALQAMGILSHFASYLTVVLKNDFLIGLALGLLSSIIDNVPLVAAAQAMYSLQSFAPDHHFWQFLTLTTGTGGSAIIIGSAAGVAVMGIEKINFIWYLKKISGPALLGLLGGMVVFLIQFYLAG